MRSLTFNGLFSRVRAIVRTTTFQLTLSYSLLFGISLSLLTLFFYWSTIGLIVRETDATLKSEITGLAEQYIEHGLDRLVNVIAHRIRTDESGNMLYLFASRDFRPQAGNLKNWPDVKPDEEGWIEFVHDRDDGRRVPARGRVYLLRDGLHLLVGRNIEQDQQLKQVFNRAMLVALALTLVLAAVGGYFMSNRVLNRISAFTKTTSEIVEGRLDRRLESRGTGDEFDVLAEHLNAMLERLESQVAAVRHVSDNIAHDLRTPLTRLRNRIELIAREGSDDVESELLSAVAEADELLGTFSSLLRIARIESGTYAAEFSPLDLATLLTDATDLYQGVAAEKDVVIVNDIDTGLVVDGDRNLLFQAFANLLDNAVKFAPRTSAVAISALKLASGIEVVIADKGPGVPAGDHKRVMQRFARLDRSRSLPGSGLGLSLVKAVFELHGARFAFEDNDPGLKVRIELRTPAA